jgi:hypothetical protein
LPKFRDQHSQFPIFFATSPAAASSLRWTWVDTIAKLEREARTIIRDRSVPEIGDMSGWVKAQLADLVGLLKSDVPRVKTEFRRLNLALTFTPVEAKPRPHFVVTGQCDLSALVFSFVRPAEEFPLHTTPMHYRKVTGTRPAVPGAVLALMGERSER